MVLKRFYRQLVGPRTGARNPVHPQPNIRGIVQQTLFDPLDYEECAADVSEWIVEQLVKAHIEEFPFEDVPQEITAVELFLRIVQKDTFIERPNAYFRTMLERKIKAWSISKNRRLRHQPAVDDEAVEQPDPNYDPDAQDRDITLKNMIKHFVGQASEVHQFMVLQILKGSSMLEAAKIVGFVNRSNPEDPELTRILEGRSESEAAELVELVEQGGLTDQPVNTLRTQLPREMNTFFQEHYPDALQALSEFFEKKRH